MSDKKILKNGENIKIINFYQMSVKKSFRLDELLEAIKIIIVG